MQAPVGPPATSFTPGPQIKLGAMKKKCGGIKGWALRYLILDKANRILYYYRSPKEEQPRKALDLNACIISRLTPDESNKNPGFKVTLPGVRDYIFIGANASLVDDWINALFQAKAPTVSTTQSFNTSGARGPFSASTAVPSNNNNQNNISSNNIGSNSPVTGSNSNSNNGGNNIAAAPSPVTSNFNYNGPTLAVMPRSSISGSGSTTQQAGTIPAQQPVSPQPSSSSQPAKTTQARNNGTAPGTQSARSPTQTSMDANATLVGGNGNDTNSTLVAGANSSAKIMAGQPVPVLILTSEAKKFAPIERAVVGIIRVGRYVNNQAPSEDLITFKSKVISRTHAEIWSVNGEVYIRDTKSQSGTFLNAMRLSEPAKESKPYRLKPGDIIQFGVDYKGATEDNARCISVRVDLKTRTMDAGGATGANGGVSSTLIANQNGPARSTITSDNNDTVTGQSDGATLYSNTQSNVGGISNGQPAQFSYTQNSMASGGANGNGGGSNGVIASTIIPKPQTPTKSPTSPPLSNGQMYGGPGGGGSNQGIISPVSPQLAAAGSRSTLSSPPMQFQTASSMGSTSVIYQQGNNNSNPGRGYVQPQQGFPAGQYNVSGTQSIFQQSQPVNTNNNNYNNSSNNNNYNNNNNNNMRAQPPYLSSSPPSQFQRGSTK